MSDEREFDEFYRQTARQVIHLVYATTGDLTVAQDACQEAYARAWSRWSSVRGMAEPLSWVRTVARRVAISGWRKTQARDRAYVRMGVVESTPPPDENRVAVLAALAQLPDALRETVAMFYLADLSVEQISAELGSPVGTIKARLHRGRTQLASLLREDDRVSTGKERRHG